MRDHGLMRIPAPLVAIAAWAVPGLGHVLLGRMSKAAWFGLLILGFFGLGVWLGEGASVSTARFPWHVYGQFGAGLPALLADRLLGVVPTGRTIDRLELGVVITTVAGIMNVVAMVDAYETARRGNEPS
jgi:hypothetical protein